MFVILVSEVVRLWVERAKQTLKLGNCKHDVTVKAPFNALDELGILCLHQNCYSLFGSWCHDVADVIIDYTALVVMLLSALLKTIRHWVS